MGQPVLLSLCLHRNLSQHTQTAAVCQMNRSNPSHPSVCHHNFKSWQLRCYPRSHFWAVFSGKWSLLRACWQDSITLLLLEQDIYCNIHRQVPNTVSWANTQAQTLRNITGLHQNNDRFMSEDGWTEKLIVCLQTWGQRQHKSPPDTGGCDGVPAAELQHGICHQQCFCSNVRGPPTHANTHTLVPSRLI